MVKNDGVIYKPVAIKNLKLGLLYRLERNILAITKRSRDNIKYPRIRIPKHSLLTFIGNIGTKCKFLLHTEPPQEVLITFTDPREINGIDLQKIHALTVVTEPED
jgi:hypothetical protein